MTSHAKLPQGITITPCETPPHPDCAPGTWWRYEVATRSGRNHVTGYVPGRRTQAIAKAKALLKHMREIEGERATRSAWRTQPKVPDGHELATCGCITCHNMRRRARKEKSSRAHRATTTMIFGANRGEFV